MATTSPLTVYTDGGCKPNPGPGGWGAVILAGKKVVKELKGGEPDTTNNRMELRAAIEALKALDQGSQVDMVTDSQYLQKGITQWLAGWQRRGWRTTTGEAVKNRDLWQELATELVRHTVRWRWTRGHVGTRWNERADTLASSMIPGAALPRVDDGAVHLFTAAAYSGKSKTGGWGVVLRHREREKTLSGRVADTSANRMHILAAVAGLEQLKRPVTVHVYTVSDYLKDGASQWLSGWKRRGFTTQEGTPVSHADLWRELDALLAQHQVEWHAVGRDDAPPELEEAKRRAAAAVKGEDLPGR